jgi:hypothetical protein
MIPGSSSVEDFSTPGVETIGGVRIQRIAPGEAIGSHDLGRWASRRSAGLSKAYTSNDERRAIRNWTQPQKTPTTTQASTRDDAAARGIIIERSGYGRCWLVSMPDGSNAGPFKTESAAWGWIDRQTSRRYGR